MAMMSESADLDRPQLRWLYLEPSRTMAEVAMLPIFQQFLKRAPMGDGHPVMVLPGFMAGDSSTGVLRRFLASRGYEAYPWELGRNLGTATVGHEGELIAERIEEISDSHGGQKISLVGWSLGGVLAREVAKRAPDAVRQVITLGSPFSGKPETSRAWPLFKVMAKGETQTQRFRELVESIAVPPSIPTTSIYTKTDGIVHWKNSIEAQEDHTDNIEVRTSHCGLGFNAPTMYAVADRLAQQEDNWRPFHREGWRALVYPSSGH
ncbi:MAG: hypothetical protein CMI60_07010 [Parvibaculum sp.]|jgi:pimeloyl-ACP methyl ester carboxylesterase|nr:hypothetical protein [Parvibaculum sp.]|tara:strand:- start:1296 stop:2087 length:792 start_codon:yes stop_codon:yes gene_type:complete